MTPQEKAAAKRERRRGRGPGFSAVKLPVPRPTGKRDPRADFVPDSQPSEEGTVMKGWDNRLRYQPHFVLSAMPYRLGGKRGAKDERRARDGKPRSTPAVRKADDAMTSSKKSVTGWFGRTR